MIGGDRIHTYLIRAIHSPRGFDHPFVYCAVDVLLWELVLHYVIYITYISHKVYIRVMNVPHDCFLGESLDMRLKGKGRDEQIQR